MADDLYSYNPDTLDGIGEDENIKQGISGLMSPAPAQSLVMPPPNTPPKTGSSQTTPQTGTLAVPPQQAQPKVSGAPMIPGIATKPETLQRQMAQSQQAYNSAQPINPGMPSSIGATTSMPSLQNAAQPSVVPDKLNMRTQQDQDKLAQLQSQPSGGSQIQNRWGRILAKVGDVAGSVLAPGVTQWIPGSTLNHQRQLGIAQGNVQSDEDQQQKTAQLEDTTQQTQQRAQKAALEMAQAQAAGNKPDPNAVKTVTTADGVMQFNPGTGKYDQKVGDAPDKLNKYQIVTGGDGNLYRIDPSDPTSASPINGPDGKPISGKRETDIKQIEVGGKPHQVLFDKATGKQLQDLGETGEKPPSLSVNTGTWGLDEDKDGNPVMFNSKTGETRAAPANLQKPGTKAKADAATAKANEPVDAAADYANNYVQNHVFTGPGDEALQEKFFELAKPSTGFRMSQPQIDMLQNARGWMGSASARFRHATTGTWFSDDQRQQIVDTMNALAASKKRVAGGSSQSSGSQGGMPPQSVVSSMKEGQFVHGPGGSYQKKGGRLVPVQSK